MTVKEVNYQADVKAVLARLERFYPPDTARFWLAMKHSAMGNERPIDLIKTGRVEFVMAVLDRLIREAGL